jgi:hypothetical protein
VQGSGASLMRGIRRTRVPEADLPLVGWGYAMTKEGCIFCEIAADLEDPLVTRLGDVLVLPALKQRERNRGQATCS